MLRCTKCGGTEIEAVMSGRGIVAVIYRDGDIIATNLENFSVNVAEHTCTACGGEEVENV